MKMWFAVRFYSAAKETETLKHAGKWMELENMLREGTQAQKDIYVFIYVFSFTYES